MAKINYLKIPQREEIIPSNMSAPLLNHVKIFILSEKERHKHIVRDPNGFAQSMGFKRLQSVSTQRRLSDFVASSKDWLKRYHDEIKFAQKMPTIMCPEYTFVEMEDGSTLKVKEDLSWEPCPRLLAKLERKNAGVQSGSKTSRAVRRNRMKSDIPDSPTFKPKEKKAIQLKQPIEKVEVIEKVDEGRFSMSTVLENGRYRKVFEQSCGYRDIDTHAWVSGAYENMSENEISGVFNNRLSLIRKMIAEQLGSVRRNRVYEDVLRKAESTLKNVNLGSERLRISVYKTLANMDALIAEWNDIIRSIEEDKIKSSERLTHAERVEKLRNEAKGQNPDCIRKKNVTVYA